MRKYNTVIINLLAVLLLFGTDGALAASIAIGKASNQADTQPIILPVSLTSDAGEQVTALQFDISFDVTKLTLSDVTIGASCTDAQKRLAFASRSNGSVRIVIYGVNQTPIADGLLAHFVFSVQTPASPGNVNIICRNAVASNPNAQAITLNAEDGSVNIAGSSNQDAGADGSGSGSGCFLRSLVPPPLNTKP